jgi:hypothetical protein
MMHGHTERQIKKGFARLSQSAKKLGDHLETFLHLMSLHRRQQVMPLPFFALFSGVIS